LAAHGGKRPAGRGKKLRLGHLGMNGGTANHVRDEEGKRGGIRPIRKLITCTTSAFPVVPTPYLFWGASDGRAVPDHPPPPGGPAGPIWPSRGESTIHCIGETVVCCDACNRQNHHEDPVGGMGRGGGEWGARGRTPPSPGGPRGGGASCGAPPPRPSARGQGRRGGAG